MPQKIGDISLINSHRGGDDVMIGHDCQRYVQRAGADHLCAARYQFFFALYVAIDEYRTIRAVRHIQDSTMLGLSLGSRASGTLAPQLMQYARARSIASASSADVMNVYGSATRP